MIQISMTVEQFLEQRGEMPEGGQWAELIAGVPVFLEPPDVDHGTVVLNLSKALAGYFHSQPSGYAAFDLGLHLARQPDTVLFPAISLFQGGPRFAETDNEVAASIPEVVVDIHSTPDRREKARERVAQILAYGVQSVWGGDPRQQRVRIETRTADGITIRELSASEIIDEIPGCPGLRIAAEALFVVPEWSR
ncbi:MAG: Uma2 family endonuclease [Planctomycetota bacterium]|nr:MAG: Uma2 family endonuclease [Planctomycetota bacterium]